MKSLLFILAALSLSCGVSTSYTGASAPDSPYAAAVVGTFDYEIDEPDARGAQLVAEFSTVLAEELQNTGGFSTVATDRFRGRAVRIEGDVTYLAEGNDALRIGVGFGTGKARFYVTARFYDHASGKLLGTMSVERSSKQGLMGVADTFAIVRRSAAGDIAAKAAEFAASR